ncbi:hypothetical protein SDJN03_11309, partial [Cucurbita argyrosperma subsp. sororia]
MQNFGNSGGAIFFVYKVKAFHRLLRPDDTLVAVVPPPGLFAASGRRPPPGLGEWPAVVMGSKSLSNSKKKNKGNKSKEERNLQSSASDNKKIITDPRFSSVHFDPRFQNVPKHKAKVAIDSRFDRMFVDKRFGSSSAQLDKRGKPKKGKSENPLRHYYKIEEKSEKNDSEEDVETEEKVEDVEKEEKIEDVEKEEKVDSESVESDVEVEEKNQILELEESESEDDGEIESDYYTTDTDQSDLDEIYDDETSELPVENIPEIDKETHRLAVVNLDWRHVKAVDLFVVLSSFLPKGGQILSVAVYPSEFGLQRMKEEELHGPVGLFDDEQEKNDGDDDDDDDEEIDNEKLRAYEMSRLRYYYAVVECDSIATADYLYKTCDGVEFERSSNVLDLRFIPDSMEFKHPPRDTATEAPSSYEVLNFHTPALQHSKIHLSWDEDEPQRVTALKRKFNADQLADLELKEFLASDESESEDESGDDDGVEDQTDKKRKKGDKYRALLQSDEDGEQDGGQDMEVTFNTGLEDISKRILEKKDKKSETLWEAHLRKRREKRVNARSKSARSSDDDSSDTDREVGEEAGDFFVEEPPVKQSKKDRTKNIKDREHVGLDGEAEASRAELELLLADDDGVDTGIKGYNLKHKKKKGKEDIAEDKIPTVDYSDPRFSALFNSPLYALDPTDPQFKRSAAYVRQVALKQQKVDGYQLTKSQLGESSTKQPAASGDDTVNSNVPVKTEGDSSTKKYELSSLVKSIKMKSQQLQLLSGGRKTPKEDGKKRPRATGEERQLPPNMNNKSGKKKPRKMKGTED